MVESKDTFLGRWRWQSATRRASLWRQGGNRSMLTTELVAGGGNPRDILAATSLHPSIHLAKVYSSILLVQPYYHKQLWFGRLGLLSFAITQLTAELLCAGGWEAAEPSSAHHTHPERLALLHLIGATVGP